ncbi:MAG: hypothetical protein Kow0059_02280 [Candidatus Sumerlaeia bacterium]
MSEGSTVTPGAPRQTPPNAAPVLRSGEMKNNPPIAGARSGALPDDAPDSAPTRITPEPVVGEPLCTYPLERSDLIPKLMAKWFWDVYDGLLPWVIMNLCVFFAASAWGFLVYSAVGPIVLHAGPDATAPVRFFLLAVVGGLIIVPIHALALSWMMPYARGFTHYTEPEFRWPPRGFQCVRRFFILTGLHYLGNFFLLFNIIFYATSAPDGTVWRWGSLMLAGLFFWILLGVNAMFIFAGPMIAENRWGWREVIHRALFIVLVHKWFSLAVLMMTGLVWVLGIYLKLIGLAVFCHALTVTLANAAYQTIVDHHRALDALREVTEKPDSVRPRTWKEKRALEERGVLALAHGKVQPTRYQRTIRDILRPWE